MLVDRGSPKGPVNVARGVTCKIVEVLRAFRMVCGVQIGIPVKCVCASMCVRVCACVCVRVRSLLRAYVCV